jgi:hypothetical protein
MPADDQPSYDDHHRETDDRNDPEPNEENRYADE